MFLRLRGWIVVAPAPTICAARIVHPSGAVVAPPFTYRLVEGGSPPPPPAPLAFDWFNDLRVTGHSTLPMGDASPMAAYEALCDRAEQGQVIAAPLGVAQIHERHVVVSIVRRRRGLTFASVTRYATRTPAAEVTQTSEATCSLAA